MISSDRITRLPEFGERARGSVWALSRSRRRPPASRLTLPGFSHKRRQLPQTPRAPAVFVSPSSNVGSHRAVILGLIVVCLRG